MNAREQKGAPGWRLTPVALAGLLALALAGTGHAQPTQPRWEVSMLPATPGFILIPRAIGADGTIVGSELRSDLRVESGLVWRGDGRVDVQRGAADELVVWLGVNAAGDAAGARCVRFECAARRMAASGAIETLAAPAPWTTAYAYGIADNGRLVGLVGNASSQQAVVFGPVAPELLGTLPGDVSSAALAISRSGRWIGGDSGWAAARQRGFVHDGQSMFEVPALGTDFPTTVLGVNDAGFAVGVSGNRPLVGGAGWSQALRPAPGAVGWTEQGRANAVNNAGQVVGYFLSASLTPRRSHAFLMARGQVLDLEQLPGMRPDVRNAVGINDRRQIALALADDSIGRATLVTNVWEGAGSGSWEDAASWSYGIAPNRLADVHIDPTRSLDVRGPRGEAEVRRLVIGGGGGGIATLRLDGGRIVAGPAADDNLPIVQVLRSGVLTGDGTLALNAAFGTVVNAGTVQADNLRIASAMPWGVAVLGNNGLIVGNRSGPARIVADQFQNLAGGRIRVLAGERLELEGSLVMFDGNLEVLGGQFTHSAPAGGEVLLLSNGPQRGRLVAQDALLTLGAGAVMQGGQMAFTAGNSNVFGHLRADRSIADGRGGQILVTGGAQATFYDEVSVGDGSELRIAAGSTGTFLGLVRQRNGALFTGSGRKFYEGGLAVGNSPGIGIDEGDVIFAGSNVYEAEIGGTVPGTGHDKLIVRGLLAFGGTLQLLSWQGYSGQVGDRYDLFDWGTTEGQFDAIDSSAFLLAPGARLDFSRLYLDGTVAIAAVPEPGTWALMALGLGAVAWRGRRLAERVAKVQP